MSYFGQRMCIFVSHVPCLTVLAQCYHSMGHIYRAVALYSTALTAVDATEAAARLEGVAEAAAFITEQGGGGGGGHGEKEKELLTCCFYQREMALYIG